MQPPSILFIAQGASPKSMRLTPEPQETDACAVYTREFIVFISTMITTCGSVDVCGRAGQALWI